ncbi:hypothetical protein RFI_16440 [Reticulomyxa filosa]|uniref:Uncharacterized protein n=1 Tax=Reticulomyxa filosa TaxID=46433 RepID=X6N4D5_RETFI|nr:hypothetical protein RFI_16440 [Reticulomyxa filosa]|eukprot:ETO20778.1 hypothetical protein RFI_16440 [Reticulomyxa filosa]
MTDFVESLDVKKHWNRNWRNLNVEAAKMVEQLLNKNEHGLIVVASNTSNQKKMEDDFSLSTQLNAYQAEKVEFGKYSMYVIKSRLIILDRVCIDGNVYAVNCEIQCKKKCNITTQLYCTADAIIDEKLKESILPIQWNTKMHHDIPIQLKDLEDKGKSCLGQTCFYDGIKHLENHLKLSMNTFGPTHRLVSISYNLLGTAYSGNRQYNKAIKFYEQSLKIVLDNFGTNCDFAAQLYQNLGNAYESKSAFDKAIECHEKSMKIKLETFGSNHASVAVSYYNLGGIYFRQRYFDKAIEYDKKALTIRKQIFGNTSKCVGNVCWNLGANFQLKGYKRTACEYFEQAWMVYSVTLGDWNESTLRAKKQIKALKEEDTKQLPTIKRVDMVASSEDRNRIKHLNFKKHWNVRWKIANESATKMVEKMIKGGGQGLIIVASNISQMNDKINEHLHKINDEPCLFLSLMNSNKAVKKRTFGSYCIYAIESKLVIFDDGVDIDGNVYAINCSVQCQKNVKISMQFFVSENTVVDPKLQLSITPTQWNTKIYHDIPLQLEGLIHKSKNCSKKSLFADAISCAQKSVKIAIRTFGDEHPYVADTNHYLGVAYYKKKRYRKAITCYEKAFHIRSIFFGTNHDEIATTYNCLGITYDRMGKYDKAIEYHEKALQIRLANFTKCCSAVATSYNNLGAAYSKTEQYDKAIECHESALKIKLNLHGTNHNDVASLYHNLGIAYDKKKQYNKAIEHKEKVLEIRTQIFGKKHRAIASANMGLGRVFEATGERETACKYYEEAWKVYSMALGEFDRETLQAKAKVQEKAK